jgi:hypothetical protein
MIIKFLSRSLAREAYDQITENVCQDWLKKNQSKLQESIGTWISNNKIHDCFTGMISYGAFFHPKIESYASVIPSIKEFIDERLQPKYTNRAALKL